MKVPELVEKLAVVHGSCPNMIEEVWVHHCEPEGPTEGERQAYVKATKAENVDKMLGVSNSAGLGLNMVKPGERGSEQGEGES
jgi:hypothetical protein